MWLCNQHGETRVADYTWTVTIVADDGVSREYVFPLCRECAGAWTLEALADPELPMGRIEAIGGEQGELTTTDF